MSEQLSLYFDTLEELSEKDQEYMSRKYRHVLEKLDEIDALLNETSNGWKTKRMSRVDLTALRLAVYELKYDKDVPTGVAINEAVELARKRLCRSCRHPHCLPNVLAVRLPVPL